MNQGQARDGVQFGRVSIYSSMTVFFHYIVKLKCAIILSCDCTHHHASAHTQSCNKSLCNTIKAKPYD